MKPPTLLLVVVVAMGGCASPPPSPPDEMVVIEPSPVPSDEEGDEGSGPRPDEAAVPAGEAEPTEQEPPAATGSASAATSPTPPAAETAARAAFRDGIVAYQAGDHAQALAHFENAYALAPLPRLLHNMAMAALHAGLAVKACRYYVEGRRLGNASAPELDGRCSTP